MTQPARTPARRGAFSLLEALVAVAIATAFLGAIAVFTSNLGDARARLSRSSREIECAESVFIALERACATVVLDAADAGDGIEGDAARLRMVRSGVGFGDDGGARFSEFVAVAVRFDAALRRVTIERGSQEEIQSAPVRALRFRYLTEDGWQEIFRSSDSGAFPVAIEASIWFDRGDAGEGEVAESTPPDRRRLVRITGGPKLDALAIRRIDRESGP